MKILITALAILFAASVSYGSCSKQDQSKRNANTAQLSKKVNHLTGTAKTTRTTRASRAGVAH